MIQQLFGESWIDGMNDSEEYIQDVLAILNSKFRNIALASSTPRALQHNIAIEDAVDQSIWNILPITVVGIRPNTFTHVVDL